MNAIEFIRDTVLNNATLCEFRYHGKSGNIDPGYLEDKPDSFLLWYDGQETIVYGFDAVLRTPFLDGHCLADAAGELTDLEG